MKRMDPIEHGIQKSKLAWVNIIASRCKRVFIRCKRHYVRPAFNKALFCVAICVLRVKGKDKQVTHILERVEAHYDVIEVDFGAVYKWCPANIVVECDCGERATLTRTVAVCPSCTEDHEGIVQEELEAVGPREEARHPWRGAS